MGTAAAGKRNDDDDDQLQAPGTEDVHGLTVDVADLAEPKKEGEDRSTRRGGDERDDDLPLDQRSALEEGRDPEEVAAIREKRRQERIRKRESQRERETQKDQRIEDLTQTVNSMLENQRRQQVVDFRGTLENIETEQDRLVGQYNEAKALKAKAFKDRDNPDSASIIVEADEAISAAKDRYAYLDAQKNRMVAAARAQAQQPRVNPELAKHATAFMKENEWYDRNGSDRDSAAVLRLDKKMFSEGWDPTTPGYWEELRERVKEELPHRFGKGGRGSSADLDDDERPPRRQITGGGGDRSLGEGKVHIPAEYVKNLKEAGMWEDVKVRNKMLRQYVLNRRKIEDQRRAS